jgi:hypothetical protein
MEFIFEFCCWVGLSEPLDQNIEERDVNSGALICNRGDTIGYGPQTVISGIQYKFCTMSCRKKALHSPRSLQ